MKKFRHLDWSDRLCIEKLYNDGESCLEIAHLLGFAPSSIYREVKHGLYPHLGAETSAAHGTTLHRSHRTMQTIRPRQKGQK